jgi:hypothetical protein
MLYEHRDALVRAITEKHGRRHPTGNFVLIYDEDDETPSVNRIAIEDTEEALAALARFELAEKAIAACYAALSPLNAPFVEEQKRQARAQGAIPDWKESYDAVMKGRAEENVRLEVDSQNMRKLRP